MPNQTEAVRSALFFDWGEHAGRAHANNMTDTHAMWHEVGALERSPERRGRPPRKQLQAADLQKQKLAESERDEISQRLAVRLQQRTGQLAAAGAAPDSIGVSGGGGGGSSSSTGGRRGGAALQQHGAAHRGPRSVPMPGRLPPPEGAEAAASSAPLGTSANAAVRDKQLPQPEAASAADSAAAPPASTKRAQEDAGGGSGGGGGGGWGGGDSTQATLREAVADALSDALSAFHTFRDTLQKASGVRRWLGPGTQPGRAVESMPAARRLSFVPSSLANEREREARERHDTMAMHSLQARARVNRGHSSTRPAHQAAVAAAGGDCATGGAGAKAQAGGQGRGARKAAMQQQARGGKSAADAKLEVGSSAAGAAVGAVAAPSSAEDAQGAAAGAAGANDPPPSRARARKGSAADVGFARTATAAEVARKSATSLETRVHRAARSARGARAAALGVAISAGEDGAPGAGGIGPFGGGAAAEIAPPTRVVNLKDEAAREAAARRPADGDLSFISLSTSPVPRTSRPASPPGWAHAGLHADSTGSPSRSPSRSPMRGGWRAAPGGGGAVGVRVTVASGVPHHRSNALASPRSHRRYPDGPIPPSSRSDQVSARLLTSRSEEMAGTRDAAQRGRAHTHHTDIRAMTTL